MAGSSRTIKGREKRSLVRFEVLDADKRGRRVSRSAWRPSRFQVSDLTRQWRCVLPMARK